MQHEDPDRPRPWAEVLTEAVHNLDALQRTQRDVRLALLRGEAVTPEDLDRLLRFSQAAAHLVEVGVRTNVGVELVRQARLSVEMDGALVFRALAAAHDAQHRLLEERGVPQDLAEALLVAAHEAAGEELRRAEDPAYREDLRRASLRELEGGRPA